MLSASSRRPRAPLARSRVTPARPSNGTKQPPLTRKHLRHLSKWLRNAAAFQPTVTDETAASVRDTDIAILCTSHRNEIVCKQFHSEAKRRSRGLRLIGVE